MRPLIGITQRLREGRHGERDRLGLDPAYAEAVAEAGGVPLHVPIQADAAGLCQRLHGLVIPGGPDFPPPTAYADDVAFDLVSERQVAFDEALLAAALARDVPVLGICYGMQLLALHAGGGLHHHLPVDCRDALDHQPDDAAGGHGLRVEPGTRLARILGDAPVDVNSRHHQAVCDPGALRVSARAPDGVIEAVEDAGQRLCLGVQWHPERLSSRHRRAVFGALVGACRREDAA